MPAEGSIITRKRKKYKFARFAAFANCFEADEFIPAIRDAFIGGASLTLELGAGNGLFSVELARRYPDKRFIAVDVKADRLQTGAKLATQETLPNIIFVRAHADQLSELFKNASMSELWLTFPDPYPKKRAAKHRLTHPHFLQLYCTLLPSNGILHFKTDNRDLFEWSAEHMAEARAQLQFLTFDLHRSDASADYRIMTTYERRYIGENKPIYALGMSLLS